MLWLTRFFLCDNSGFFSRFLALDLSIISVLVLLHLLLTRYVFIEFVHLYEENTKKYKQMLMIFGPVEHGVRKI